MACCVWRFVLNLVIGILKESGQTLNFLALWMCFSFTLMYSASFLHEDPIKSVFRSSSLMGICSIIQKAQGKFSAYFLCYGDA